MLNCTFSVIFFSETWSTDNSICNDSNFQTENYTVLLQVRESGRGGVLRIVYFKPRADPSINSNDEKSICIEIHHKKDKNILFRPTRVTRNTAAAIDHITTNTAVSDTGLE